MGPIRIVWYPERYLAIRISDEEVHRIPKRHGLNRLPRNLGRRVYIKPRSPQLNGKVERSHRTDKEEFYQLLNYVDDVISMKNSPTRNAFTTSIDPMALLLGRHHMRHSENAYNSSTQMSG